MAVISYWPEMGQKAPKADGDVRYSYNGHYRIKTPLLFKGRGIKHLGVLTADRLTEFAQHKAGWNEYVVTERALEQLSVKYTFAREALLD